MEISPANPIFFWLYELVIYRCIGCTFSFFSVIIIKQNYSVNIYRAHHMNEIYW